MTDLADLSATQAAHRLRDGSLSATALVEALLDRVAAREPVLRALAIAEPLNAFGIGMFFASYMIFVTRTLDFSPGVLGVIFGLWGIALALPMMAVIKVLLEQLYVEDTLGEDPTV